MSKKPPIRVDKPPWFYMEGFEQGDPSDFDNEKTHVGHQFTCYICKQKCQSSWSHEEANKELKDNFDVEFQEKELASVCDTCYQKLKVKWLF